jgi:MFS family permease
VKARLTALIVGSSLAATGLGALLPYLYSDIATTRGFGGLVAALTFIAFSLGSLAAAPAAGRLADGRHPVVVAATSRVLMAAGVLALGMTTTASLTLAAAALAGMAYALTQPSINVLLLSAIPDGNSERTRQVFAAQFIGVNLALALGGFVAGMLVDLSTPAGARPIFLIAAAAELVSAAVVTIAARGYQVTRIDNANDGAAGPGIFALLRLRPLRLLVGVTLLLTLACYAQYDSGLPAYALGNLHVRPSTLGIGVALNAIVVSVLTVPVVALTRRYSPTTMLAWCAGLWIGCWLIFALPLLAAGSSTATLSVLIGYVSISFGESMLAPVLNPFAATLAPEGSLGRTLGAITGATTLGNAVGPGLSGVLLALHLPAGFIALQLLCCVGAVALAVSLGRLVGHRAGAAEGLASEGRHPAVVV